MRLIQKNSSNIFTIRENHEDLAEFRADINEDSVRIHLSSVFTDDGKTLHYLTEQTIRRWHPQQIILINADPSMHLLWNGCGYYARGENYCYKTEPWRLKMPDRMFDEEGYIINQGLAGNLPFGWFNSKDKGCGWIAAWNLLKMNGIYVPMEEAAREIGDHALLGGVMGSDMYALKRWLRKKGLTCQSSLPADAHMLHRIQACSSGILLYHHARGAHYCAFRRTEGEHFHFYNAVYGRLNHIDTMPHFLQTFALLPISMCLTVEG